MAGHGRHGPRDAAGIPPGPAAPSRPPGAPRAAHPDSRVPPQPGSRAPLPPASCTTQVSGPARTHAPVGFRRAGPGARIAGGARRHLHCTGPGKAGAAPPPPGFMAARPGTPPPPAARRLPPAGCPPPRLRAAERGRMWRSRACSVAVALGSCRCRAPGRSARGSPARRSASLPAARGAGRLRASRLSGVAVRSELGRSSHLADPFPTSLAVLRTSPMGFFVLRCTELQALLEVQLRTRHQLPCRITCCSNCWKPGW